MDRKPPTAIVFDEQHHFDGLADGRTVFRSAGNNLASSQKSAANSGKPPLLPTDQLSTASNFS